eukprot:TRINITY_DN7074_c0_g1_i2.p1 TRINITY_DN7074_c0_g1~~TRINITY_DN7074_c0_g1_i2.p1  ORF type:complete len:764 (-),score=225.11 TRINITY_DN7074_c0_g1_i2:48-2339(-)
MTSTLDQTGKMYLHTPPSEPVLPTHCVSSLESPAKSLGSSADSAATLTSSSGASNMSVAIVESNSVPHKHKDVHVGILGRGFNILTGFVKAPLFEELKAVFSHGNERQLEKMSFFKDFQEFEREMAARIGINDYTEGMLSLCTETKHMPILCPVEKIENFHYLMMEITEDCYYLNIEPSGVKGRTFSEKDIEFALQGTFDSTNKSDFYAFFEKFGTHYIKQVNYGAKAEMVWTYEERFFDVLDKVTKTQKYKKKFGKSFDDWKQSGYSENNKATTPGLCAEFRRVTPNFLSKSRDKMADAEPIGFLVEEISRLFDNKKVRKAFEIAAKVYIEEMKPIRDLTKVTDGQVVGLFHPESRCWVKVDASGHLWLSDSHKPTMDCKFETKKKGNKVGLKSIQYGKKLVSRALTKPNFNFHRLQFIGPHESFQLCGDYLMICGNISAPTFLVVTGSKEISHDGSQKRKSRLLLLSLDNRSALNEDVMTQQILEPVYDEDVTADVVDDLGHPQLIVSGERSVGPSPVYKSNSTSSLFIKETVHMPNIDELTRKMAAKLLRMMREPSINEDVKGEIFNEEKHPLNAQPPNFKSLSLETIFHFINTIFKIEKLQPEVCVMSMIYIQRVLLKTHMNLTPYIWRRLCLSCIILASKVYEDLAVWNADFIELFPEVRVQDLNRLEKNLLRHLDFNVSFTRQEYIYEFFELYQHTSPENRDGTPLNEEALKKLEIRSAASEKMVLSKVNKAASITVLPSEKSQPKTKSANRIGMLM